MNCGGEMKTNISRIVAMLWLALATLTAVRAQSIDGFYVDPPSPTTSHFVMITVYGNIAWANIRLVGGRVVTVDNDFEIWLSAITDGDVGIPIQLPYSRTISAAVLASGRYSVRAYFCVNDWILSTGDTAFVVSEPMAVEQSSFGFNTVSDVNLYPNHPNPFNPSTIILYDLAHASEVELAVFDLLGRRIRTLVQEHQQAGQHRLLWNGKDDSGVIMPSGVYLYRLRTSKFMQTRRMILIH